MTDDELRLKMEADAIASRIYLRANKPTQQPASSVDAVPPIPATCEDLPRVVVADIRIPWNSMARLVVQALLLIVLVSVAAAGLVGLLLYLYMLAV